MNLFVLNIIIAIIWLLLAEQPTVTTFIIGFGIGFMMIAILKPVFRETSYLKTHFYKSSDYIKKTLNFSYFVIWFIIQFLIANIKIAWAVLTRPKNKIQPSIFTMDVTNLSTFEIVMLSQSITLTPGTTTVQVSDDQNTIYVHAFDGEEVEEERQAIQNGLIKNILRFTR